MSPQENTTRRNFLKTTGAIVGAGSVVGLSAAGAAAASDREPGFSAGAAQRDITPPVGMKITHYVRENKGAHDPLFVRTLVLEDGDGNSVALITGDLIGAGFVACDEIRERVKKATGVGEVWFSCSHSHAARWLVPTPKPGQERTDELAWDEGEDHPITDDPAELKWNNDVHKAIVEIVTEAKAKAVPVTLRIGRAQAQVGFNRRITGPDGYTYMGVNREAPAVPWVNVLVANARETNKPVAVMFEHAAHPVTVPHTSKLVSADFPGAAVARIRQDLGDDVIALFGQGCSANINSFPLRSTHDDADSVGQKLGDAALKAVRESELVKATTLKIRNSKTQLPTQDLPPAEMVAELIEKHKDEPERIKQLKKITAMRESGGTPAPRRFDVYGVMLGDDWCLVGMPFETFCQLELWIDENAPFKRTMTFSLTNGGRGYIGSDEGLAMGSNGGYEAGSLPGWIGHETMSPNLGPPAVGTEKIIKQAVKDLWA
ncbi:MAG: hypothetical protein WBF93_18955 [Pirellulales bacterium]|nr:hypothetical protein [Pirellulales bacterium]